MKREELSPEKQPILKQINSELWPDAMVVPRNTVTGW